MAKKTKRLDAEALARQLVAKQARQPTGGRARQTAKRAHKHAKEAWRELNQWHKWLDRHPPLRDTALNPAAIRHLDVFRRALAKQRARVFADARHLKKLLHRDRQRPHSDLGAVTVQLNRHLLGHGITQLSQRARLITETLTRIGHPPRSYHSVYQAIRNDDLRN